MSGGDDNLYLETLEVHTPPYSTRVDLRASGRYHVEHFSRGIQKVVLEDYVALQNYHDALARALQRKP